MNYGLTLVHTDHRDLDFHKTFGTVNFDTNTLPDRYSADAGLTMPDQNADGYPYGCTGYAQTDICTDQDLMVYHAGEFYLSTPPGGLDGRMIRASLNLLVSRGPKTVDGQQGEPRERYFNIRAGGILDWFDAIRVALWITQAEKRSASIGIPWFPEFNTLAPDAILPEDTILDWRRGGGHNAKIGGWTDVKTNGEYIRNGELFLAVKSWQGPNYGDRGWCYMSRILANRIFSLSNTDAFTVTKKQGTAKTVDLDVVARLVSYIRLLLRRAGLL